VFWTRRSWWRSSSSTGSSGRSRRRPDRTSMILTKYSLFGWYWLGHGLASASSKEETCAKYLNRRDL
jgi:hypothetical protein